MIPVSTSLPAILKALAQKPKISDVFKPDPEKIREAEKISATLRQVSKAMRTSADDIGRQRKAMASEKIARIKEALKTLRQFVGADPKTVARMAKQLARELAAALKEYAAAGATFSEIAASDGDTGMPQHSTHATELDKTTNEKGSTEQAAQTLFERGTHAYVAREAEKGMILSFDEDENILRIKDDDSAFLKDAQDILNELRRIIRSQRPRQNTHDPHAEKEIRMAEPSLEAAEKAFRHLGFALH